MKDEEIQDAIDGLFAYDTGSVDSGIHDELLREKIKVILKTDYGEVQLDRYARRMMASDSPYGLEDIKEFIEWLSNRMDYDL